ncbi:shikimate dehydrogenase [Microseira wollei]|uniref:Shikimate dehydrogenase (NADP(+)) n=1 Tax=Microseira wollei NIES-4236 TaxID=2530354 RepID=A0AAV3XNN3_9CYAN|nr:shikimate dehydrogenase [Microseira wollei]GET41800.1 shikimate 5-dehydrogenase [Microseira wollei NIES-4236]
MITGRTKLLGIIGYPVEHSLSPVMQNAALAHMGLDYVYVPFPIKPENLQQAIASFTAIDNLVGFNVTIPHKQEIIDLLPEVSPIAQAVGAVNTVWRTENGWSGTNTDVEGFLAPLKHQIPPTPLSKGGWGDRDLELTDSNWHQTTAVILGYGGAARAVVAGCAELGCANIIVVGRNQQTLNDFLASWRNSTFIERLSVHTWQELPELLSRANLLVNATPVGMYPQVDESPVTGDEMKLLPKGAIAYDLIYTPNPTQFLTLAQDRGAIAIDGLEMLVQQGASALKIWLQRQDVPVDVMRQSLRRHLG